MWGWHSINDRYEGFALQIFKFEELDDSSNQLQSRQGHFGWNKRISEVASHN